MVLCDQPVPIAGHKPPVNTFINSAMPCIYLVDPGAGLEEYPIPVKYNVPYIGKRFFGWGYQGLERMIFQLSAIDRCEIPKLILSADIQIVVGTKLNGPHNAPV